MSHFQRVYVTSEVPFPYIQKTGIERKASVNSRLGDNKIQEKRFRERLSRKQIICHK